jgi:DNA processing protein
LAALAHVVVVVESHATGGSIITADEALKRGKPVLAVPGSIRSPASAGANYLFREGAAPACDPADVLAALALEGWSCSPLKTAAVGPPSAEVGPLAEVGPPAGKQAMVLDAVEWHATPTDRVVARTGLSPLEVASLLASLEMAGWVRGGGGWWERCGGGPPGQPGVGPTVGA